MPRGGVADIGGNIFTCVYRVTNDPTYRMGHVEKGKLVKVVQPVNLVDENNYKNHGRNHALYWQIKIFLQE